MVICVELAVDREGRGRGVMEMTIIYSLSDPVLVTFTTGEAVHSPLLRLVTIIEQE